VQADYRELPFADESFDAAINLFTSLGYFGDEEDARAVGEIARVLRPDGRLVIEIMHRDALVLRFRDTGWHMVGEGRLLLE
jgi:SAM-dependent methyltransferase